VPTFGFGLDGAGTEVVDDDAATSGSEGVADGALASPGGSAAGAAIVAGGGLAAGPPQAARPAAIEIGDSHDAVRWTEVMVEDDFMELGSATLAPRTHTPPSAQMHARRGAALNGSFKRPARIGQASDARR
jgi:hypothetical protein